MKTHRILSFQTGLGVILAWIGIMLFAGSAIAQSQGVNVVNAQNDTLFSVKDEAVVIPLGDGTRVPSRSFSIQGGAVRSLPYFTVTNEGLIGIGTDDPSATVDLASGSARFGGSARFDSKTSFFSSTVNDTVMDIDNGGIGIKLMGNTRVPSRSFSIQGGAVRQVPYFLVTNTGQVGIGTDDPLSTFHLATGSALFSGSSQFDGSALFFGTAVDDTVMNVDSTGVVIELDEGDGTRVPSRSFSIQGGAVRQVPYLTVQPNGFVGFGTNSPTTNLHIASGEMLIDSQTQFSNSLLQYGETVSDTILHIDPSGVIFRLDEGDGTRVPSRSFSIQGGAVRSVPYLTITPAGQVGVGVTSPDDAFEVNGGVIVGWTTNQNGGAIRYNNADGDFEGYDAVEGIWRSFTGTGTGGSDSDWVISGSNMYSGVSGFVGIGVTDPTSKLHVSGAIRATGSLVAGGPLQVGSAGTGQAGMIQYDGEDFLGYTGTGWQSLTSGGSSGWTIDAATGDMYASNTGRVGVGINIPSAKFEALAEDEVSAMVTRLDSGDGTDPFAEVLDVFRLRAMASGSNLPNAGFGGRFSIALETSNSGYSDAVAIDAVWENPNYNIRDADMIFRVRNNNNFDEYMRIRHDGNVGIGTISPQERLSVNGAIQIGDTSNQNEGTIRWNGDSFEGFDGSQWLTFGGGGGATDDGDWTINEGNLIANTGGSVGIGDGINPDPPEFKLDVDGTIFSRHIHGVGLLDASMLVRSASPSIGIYNDSAGSYYGWLIRSNTAGDLYFQQADISEEYDRYLTLANSGHVGIGAEAGSPSNPLHVAAYVQDTSQGWEDPQISAHAALIENTFAPAGTTKVDVLAVKAPHNTDYTNFITCYNENNFAMGGARSSIDLSAYWWTYGSDYAEYMPRLNFGETISKGEIVAIVEGKITKNTEKFEQLRVLTTSPAVLGNSPQPGEKDAYEQVAFLGQVPTKVNGPVNAGDFIIPSGLHDGSGIAVSPKEITGEQYAQIVGVAWESSPMGGTKLINVAIGLNHPEKAIGQLMEVVSSQKTQMSETERELSQLKAQNERLQERLSSMEDRLADIDRIEKQLQALQAAQTNDDGQFQAETQPISTRDNQ